jgi:hypothetical protein
MRIKLVRFAVEVQEGARKIRLEQRCSGVDSGGEQLIDIAVFRTAERRRLQSGRL